MHRVVTSSLVLISIACSNQSSQVFFGNVLLAGRCGWSPVRTEPVVNIATDRANLHSRAALTVVNTNESVGNFVIGVRGHLDRIVIITQGKKSSRADSVVIRRSSS